MSDKRGTMSAEPGMLGRVETMQMTADGLRHGMKGRYTQRSSEPLAVSRKPMAIPDALVYELYGLTEEEVRIVGGERK